jgi:serine/threonine protein kinase
MPFFTIAMKKFLKQAEKEEKRQKEEEECRLREENALKVKQEKERLEKEELQRRYRRNRLEFLMKYTATRDMGNEDVLENFGYIITPKLVATGAFSQLFKTKKAQNEDIICKIINLDKCPQMYKEFLLSENLKIQRFVGYSTEDGGTHHTNFCKIFDVFATNKKVFAFLEECQPLPLKTRIKSGDAISKEKAKRWIKQVAEAINYLHAIGVSHNNIRPENIIFDKHNVIKVVGLGLASIYWDLELEQLIPKKKILFKSNKEFEKLNHLPPEAFESESFDPRNADVWSVGLLLCQMVSKHNPFEIKSEKSFENQWRIFTESHQFSNDCKELLDCVFTRDANKRIKIDDFLQDKYFEKI